MALIVVAGLDVKLWWCARDTLQPRGDGVKAARGTGENARRWLFHLDAEDVQRGNRARWAVEDAFGRTEARFPTGSTPADAVQLDGGDKIPWHIGGFIAAPVRSQTSWPLPPEVPTFVCRPSDDALVQADARQRPPSDGRALQASH